MRSFFLYWFIVAASICILLGKIPAAAAPENWDFDKHPPVLIDDLPRERRSQLTDMFLQFVVETGNYNCDGRVDEMIKLYVETYPEFAPFAEMPEWRQRWIDAFVIAYYRFPIECAVVHPLVNAWWDYSRSVDDEIAGETFFCGRFTELVLPRETEKVLRRLVALAFHEDVETAAAALLMQSRLAPNPISLNGDVAYYLVKREQLIHPDDRHVGEFSMPWAFKKRIDEGIYHITPERMAEVEVAARRGDAASILATTGTCRRFGEKAIAGEP